MNVRGRQRVALGLMLLGLFCLALGVISIISQHAEHRRLAGGTPVKVQTEAQLKHHQSRLAKYWLAAAGMIVAVFLLATLLMVRFRRRVLAVLASKSAQTTSAEDVWEMHKPPDEPPDELYEQSSDTESDA